MLPDFDDLLKYRNDAIIARYQRDYPHSKLRAEDAFNELMKYIWLFFKHQADKKENNAKESLDFTCVVHVEMTDIDNMWHTFLLFTQDYHDFCRKYLGGTFFHHVPLNNTAKLLSPSEQKKQLANYLAYIHDNLGEQTLCTWFQV